MMDSQDIRGRLARSGDLHQRVLALFCARCVASPIALLATPSSVETYRTTLGTAWALLSSMPWGAHLPTPPIPPMPRLPELEADEPADPHYYAGLALCIAEQAVGAVRGVDPSDAADAAACLTLDLFSVADGLLLPVSEKQSLTPERAAQLPMYRAAIAVEARCLDLLEEQADGSPLPTAELHALADRASEALAVVFGALKR